MNQLSWFNRTQKQKNEEGEWPNLNKIIATLTSARLFSDNESSIFRYNDRWQQIKLASTPIFVEVLNCYIDLEEKKIAYQAPDQCPVVCWRSRLIGYFDKSVSQEKLAEVIAFKIKAWRQSEPLNQCTISSNLIEEASYRYGPTQFKENDWVYQSELKGGLTALEGNGKIFLRDETVYSFSYEGGLVKLK